MVTTENGSQEIDTTYKFTVCVGSNEFDDEIPCVNWPQVEKTVRDLRADNWMYGEFRAEYCFVQNSVGELYRTIAI